MECLLVLAVGYVIVSLVVPGTAERRVGRVFALALLASGVFVLFQAHRHHLGLGPGTGAVALAMLGIGVGFLVFGWRQGSQSSAPPLPRGGRMRTGVLDGRDGELRTIEFTAELPPDAPRLRVCSGEWRGLARPDPAMVTLPILGPEYDVRTNDVSFTSHFLDPAAQALIRRIDAIHRGSFLLDARPGAVSVRAASARSETHRTNDFMNDASELAQRVQARVAAFRPAPAAPRAPDAEGIVILETATASATCEVCGCALDARVATCAKCRTPHHEDCWTYNGGCSVYACGGKTALAHGGEGEDEVVEVGKKKRKKRRRGRGAAVEAPPEPEPRPIPPPAPELDDLPPPSPPPEGWRGDTFEMRRPFPARIRLGTVGGRVHDEFECVAPAGRRPVTVSSSREGDLVVAGDLDAESRRLAERLARMHLRGFALEAGPGRIAIRAFGTLADGADLAEWTRLAYEIAARLRSA